MRGVVTFDDRERRVNEYPRNIIYGTAMPDLRFRMEGDLIFCRKNDALHLTDESFVEGTFQAGRSSASSVGSTASRTAGQGSRARRS
jgi:hypothetical protein